MNKSPAVSTSDVCVCVLCLCVHTLNALWAYVILFTTCVWERDAAVVCDVFDSRHRAAHLHLFITQHMHTHTGTHIKFMAFNGPQLYSASVCKDLQEKGTGQSGH